MFISTHVAQAAEAEENQNFDHSTLPSDYAQGISGIKNTSTPHSHYHHNHLHNIPSRNPSKHHRDPALLLPILLYRHTPPITPIELGDRVNVSARPQIRRGNIAPPHAISLLERNVIAVRAVQTLQVQDVEVVLSAPAAHGIPVRTDLLKHEARGGPLVRADDGVGQRGERRRREAFVARGTGVDGGLGAAFVAAREVFPGEHGAVFAVLLAVVGGEVRSAEVDVGVCEAARVEALFVGFAGVDGAGAPAGIYEVPLAVVEAAGVPGVSGLEGRNRIVWSLLAIAAAFAGA